MDAEVSMQGLQLVLCSSKQTKAVVHLSVGNGGLLTSHQCKARQPDLQRLMRATQMPTLACETADIYALESTHFNMLHATGCTPTLPTRV
jgi:hypothetical protein